MKTDFYWMTPLYENSTTNAYLKFIKENIVMSEHTPVKIKEKKLFFLSPHPDDITLTFGGLIIANKGFKNYAKEYHVFFGTSNWTENDIDIQTNHRVETVTLTRFSENRFALNALFGGWNQYHFNFYGFYDAVLRQYNGPVTAGGGPWGNFSTFRKVEKENFEEIVHIVKRILQIKDSAVFVLMANGSHIDHFILCHAVIKAAAELGSKAVAQIYFGEDQPYTGDPAHRVAVGKEIKKFSQHLGLIPLTYSIDIEAKMNIFSNYYISQFSPSYMVGLKARAKALNGGERIYLWPKENYIKGLKSY